MINAFTPTPSPRPATVWQEITVFQVTAAELEQVLSAQAATDQQRRRVAETVAKIQQLSAEGLTPRKELLEMVLEASFLMRSKDGPRLVELLEESNQLAKASLLDAELSPPGRLN